MKKQVVFWIVKNIYLIQQNVMMLDNRKLSIIIPTYNEQFTVYTLLSLIDSAKIREILAIEILVIDDASTDQTVAEVMRFQHDFPYIAIKLLQHQYNQGKGKALRTGFSQAVGDFFMVQDADLEYNPHEIHLLLAPILEGYADVVYGSRFVGGKPHRVLFFFHSIGNKFLTFLSNLLTNLNITDMETCYKIFRREIIKQIDLKEDRFGFEPEVTAKISKIPNIRIYEIGISYHGRTYQEGKKIGWRDGFAAIYCIIKYNLF